MCACFEIDYSCHPRGGFRLAEGQDLHLLGSERRKFTVRVQELVADENPEKFGGTADVGQMAMTADGRWLVCMDMRDHPSRVGVQFFDSIADLISSLWDVGGPFSVADSLIMLWAIDGIQLNPSKWGPERQKGTDCHSQGDDLHCSNS